MTRTAIQCVVLLAAVLFATCSAEAEMIGYWSFDNDFTDSSASGNNLSTSSGAPSITTSAGEWKFGGGAADFNSTLSNEEHLALDTAINFAASDAWSVSFWGRRRSPTSDKSGMILGDLTSNGFIWTTGATAAVDGLRFRNAGTKNGVDFGNIADDNQYHHWVVIADGSGDLAVYRDNTSKGTKSSSGTTRFDITNVGQAYSNDDQSYNGQIDELYVFDEAIGSDVVASLFNSNQVPEPSTLVLAVAAALGGLVMLRRRK